MADGDARRRSSVLVFPTGGSGARGEAQGDGDGSAWQAHTHLSAANLLRRHEVNGTRSQVSTGPRVLIVTRR